MKKCGASQHGEIRPRNGNTLGNGNRIGGDALAMGRCLRVFKFKSAAENLEGVIVRLNEKLEGLVQFSGFISTSSTMVYLASIIIW